MDPVWKLLPWAVFLFLGGLVGGFVGAYVARRRGEAARAAARDEERRDLQSALDPLLKEFVDLENKLGEARVQGATDNALLRQQLAHDLKNVGDLVLRVEADARDLKVALQGNVNLRGQWGEAVLEQLLRNSGLLPGIHFDQQVALQTDARNASGDRKRPDAVVRLPDGSSVVIDSKSLFVDYAAALKAETDEARSAALRAHVQSFRTTVRDLANRRYEQQVEGSIEFVLMFLPVEAAYQAAVQEDPALLTEAMERNVLPVGPSALILMLTLIRRIWRRDEERRNTEDILKAARALAERTVAFGKELESVGAALQKAQAAYDAAQRRLQSTDGRSPGIAQSLQTLKRLQGEQKDSCSLF